MIASRFQLFAPQFSLCSVAIAPKNSSTTAEFEFLKPLLSLLPAVLAVVALLLLCPLLPSLLLLHSRGESLGPELVQHPTSSSYAESDPPALSLLETRLSLPLII